MAGFFDQKFVYLKKIPYLCSEIQKKNKIMENESTTIKALFIILIIGLLTCLSMLAYDAYKTSNYKTDESLICNIKTTTYQREVAKFTVLTKDAVQIYNICGEIIYNSDSINLICADFLVQQYLREKFINIRFDELTIQRYDSIMSVVSEEIYHMHNGNLMLKIDRKNMINGIKTDKSNNKQINKNNTQEGSRARQFVTGYQPIFMPFLIH